MKKVDNRPIFLYELKINGKKIKKTATNRELGTTGEVATFSLGEILSMFTIQNGKKIATWKLKSNSTTKFEDFLIQAEYKNGLKIEYKRIENPAHSPKLKRTAEQKAKRKAKKIEMAKSHLERLNKKIAQLEKEKEQYLSILNS